MTENKRTIIMSIITVALFIVFVVSVSYSFYTATFTINNDDENNTITGTTAQLNTGFSDGDTEDINITMIPGDYFEKKFSVINSGSTNSTLSYTIIIDELENEFDDDNTDIIYTLIENGKEIVKDKVFPHDTTDNVLSEKIDLVGGKTNSYTLIITYKNTDKDQSGDMGKSISGKIYIREE